VRKDDSNIRWRHLYPGGRVIGRPGQQQRQSTAKLKIDSMSRPFEVVVMSDVEKPKNTKASITPDATQKQDKEGSSIDASRIARDLLDPRVTPDQIEVDESIDALRPDNVIVDREQYDSLRQQLAEGYNLQQLISYRAKYRHKTPARSQEARLKANSSSPTSFTVDRSVWRPGQSPMETRHTLDIVPAKRNRGSRKWPITHDILRHAWNLTIDSEENQIGELELSLPSRHFEHLFGIEGDEQRTYEGIVQPSILLRNSEVVLSRSENIARIVARRQDAEAIAALIEQELAQMGRLEFDIDEFRPLLNKFVRKQSIAHLLPPTAARYIGQHTNTAIVHRDKRTLHIHGQSEVARQSAKRLLLSLMQLHRTTSFKVLDVSAMPDPERALVLPEISGSNGPLSVRHLSLGRLCVPVSRTTGGDTKRSNHGSSHKATSSHDNTDVARRIIEGMAPAETLASSIPIWAGRGGHDTYWEPISTKSTPALEVQFCKLLQTFDPKRETTPQKSGATPGLKKQAMRWSSNLIAHPHVPGIEDLLSYFKPMQENQYAFEDSMNPPHLIAHFVPSPSALKDASLLQKLPRIEIRYDFVKEVDTASPSSAAGLRLAGMIAKVFQEELQVPQPTEAVDICVKRTLSIVADPSRISQDDEIAKFTQSLTRSVAAKDGTLAGEPSIMIKLPFRLVTQIPPPSKRSHMPRDAEVEYLFERFEEVQTAKFEAMQPGELPQGTDPAIGRLVERMHGSSILEYRTIQGGVVAGSRTEMTLKNMPATRDTAQDGLEAHNLDTALRLTCMLTNNNGVSLQTPRQA